MSCSKCPACFQVLIIVVVVGYCLAMLSINISDYSNYEAHSTRIANNMMDASCLDICGPDYPFSEDDYNCCKSTYSCSYRGDCKVKMQAELDGLMQEAVERILIFAVITIVVVYCLCKTNCRPCRYLFRRDHYNFNPNHGYNNRNSPLIEPIYQNQEPIIVYRQQQAQNEAVDGLRQSFMVKNQDDNCAICLQGLEENKVIRLSCKHLFHGACIREWIAKHNSCPVCRMPN